MAHRVEGGGKRRPYRYLRFIALGLLYSRSAFLIPDSQFLIPDS